MELERYVDDLRDQLLVAAEAGGDDARALAGRLVAPLESSVRLILLEVLSDAANEITLELAPGSVEVRVRGRDPELVITPPPTTPTAAPTTVMVTSDDVIGDVSTPPVEPDESGMARVTLRLPESLKQRIEEAASRHSLSVNSWLVRAVTAAVEPSSGPDVGRSRPAAVNSRFTGWVR
jgi:HicB family